MAAKRPIKIYGNSWATWKLRTYLSKTDSHCKKFVTFISLACALFATIDWTRRQWHHFWKRSDSMRHLQTSSIWGHRYCKPSSRPSSSTDAKANTKPNATRRMLNHNHARNLQKDWFDSIFQNEFGIPKGFGTLEGKKHKRSTRSWKRTSSYSCGLRDDRESFSGIRVICIRAFMYEWLLTTEIRFFIFFRLSRKLIGIILNRDPDFNHHEVSDDTWRAYFDSALVKKAYAHPKFSGGPGYVPV